MGPVTIIETALLDKIFASVTSLDSKVTALYSELKESKKQFLSVAEACEYLGKASTWVYQHKADIGFSKIGNDILFKRTDLDDYIERSYYKRA